MGRWLGGLGAVAILVGFAGHGGFPPGTAPAVRAAELRSVAAEARGVDWPGFLGPSGDGKSPETGILTQWPATGPRVVWQRPLGESYGIGSVSGGRFFQFDRYGDSARLTCLDARSGKELWRFEYPTAYEDTYGYNGGPRCSPVIEGDRVYLFGVEGLLHCVKATDGSLLWKVDTAQRFGVVQNFFGVGSTPVVEGRLLLVMVGGSPAAARGLDAPRLDQVTPNGSAIVAFDKATGAVVYQTGDELASYAVPKVATINGRRWGFAFCRGGLMGFDPATGRVDFHYPWRAKLLESVNASTPVTVSEEVFISECYGPGSTLLRVRPGGCDVVWRDDPQTRLKAMQTHWNTPIYHAGYLYGCSGRNTYQAELRCIEWTTGKIMWREPGLTRTSLLYVDGHFVCLGEDGWLRLVKANPQRYEATAEVRLQDGDGRTLLEPPCWAAPILSHGLLYVRGRDRLVCLELVPGSAP